MPRDWRISPNSSAFSTTRGWGVAAEHAERQHGVVALTQLTARGVSASTVRYWVESRRLVRLHAGVYAVGHAVLRPAGHRLAAVLACGDRAVLSHASAAAHWGIRRSAAAVIDVTAPIRTGRGRAGLRIHCGARLRPDETTVEDAVPCTTVARTLLDLASVLRGRGLDAAIETSERLELFDLREIAVLLGRHQRRSGSGRLRRALADFDPELVRVRSETEACFYCLCVEAGLPRPLVNRAVRAGERSYEADLHWPAARVVPEVDSHYHDTTAARIRDRARDEALRSHGWTTLRARDETPTAPLVAELRRLVGGPTRA
jgi:very-short-patch-repair endonuclease/predicted transcriptional regulator of viral defense system